MATLAQAERLLGQINTTQARLGELIRRAWNERIQTAYGYADTFAGFTKFRKEKMVNYSMNKADREYFLAGFKWELGAKDTITVYDENRCVITMEELAAITGCTKATVSRFYTFLAKGTKPNEKGVVVRKDGADGAGAPAVASETPRETVTATVVTDDYEIARAAILRMHHNGDSRLALLAMDIMDLVREPAAIAA